MRMQETRRTRASGASRSGAHDRWLLSYADLITLMFALFTVMYAVSSVDAGKLAPASLSIQKAFSVGAVIDEGKDAAASRPAAPEIASVVPSPALGTASRVQDVRRRLLLELAEAMAAGQLGIANDPRGLVLSLPVEATFAVGSADLHGEAPALIARLAATLQPLGSPMRIEGHTDDVPIHTARYLSNWELSTARASAVVAFLIDTAGIEPALLSAAGYGEFHPRVPNDSPENRARNRRVDIVVLNPAARREEPQAVQVNR